jgi:TonB-linked SusC/RagA family outer membrane protein
MKFAFMNRKWVADTHLFTQLFRVMKLTTLFLLVACLQVSAEGSAQTVTLSFKNSPLEKVLNAIKQQTGMSFLWDQQSMKMTIPVTVKVNNVSLEDALHFCFKDNPFTYSIVGKIIVIKLKVEEEKKADPLPPPPPPTVDVTVVVQNTDGSPLEGASIRVKGTQRGITTDANGRAVLKAIAPNTTLVISFTGYGDKEVAIGNSKIINVRLAVLSKNLDEVVIIGYGQVNRKDLTGSVAQVKMKDFQKAPVTSFDQALAGRIAGVQVSATDGQPGDGSLNIVIRGNNSLTGSNTPLYVIDGFPIENPDNNSINPAEIESIDVLKDASATAIYGARGANGVIIITTKRGKAGDPVITYNGYVGLSEATKHVALLSAYDFVKLQNEGFPSVASLDFFTNGKTLDSYKNIKAIDWQSQLLRRALFQNHTIGLTGGNDKTRYTVSGSYLDQDGIIIASGFKRMQGRVTLDQQVNSKLKVGININYDDSKRTGTRPREQTSKGNPSTAPSSQQFNLMYNVWSYSPVAGGTATDSSLLANLLDPTLNAGDYRVNPIYSAQNEYNMGFTNNLSLNGYLEYALSKELKLRITGGANLYKNRNEVFNNSQTRGGSSLTVQGQLNGINGSINYNQVNDFVNENSLTYTKNFNRNNQLTATGVFSTQSNNSRAYGFNSGLLPNEGLGISGLDQGTVISTTSSVSNFTLASYTGRVNYNLYKKYLFTATFRADGSSKFADGNKWGYFPSGAFAWRLGDEDFMKKIPVISHAKLRLSYGVTGNNRVSDFAYLSQINTNSNAYYTFGNSLSQAFYVSNLGNDKLKWESTGQFDAGIEIGFLKDRINLEVDYYKKRTYDLLLNANIAPSTGFSSGTINVGKTQNQGLEFTLNTTNVSTRNFTWTTNFNISFNQSRLIGLASGEDSRLSSPSGFTADWTGPAYITRLGKPITQFYGYVYDGVYQYSDFDKLPNNTYVLKNTLPATGGLIGTSARQPGDAEYKDLNGDGIINDADQTAIGNPYPVHMGGFSNTFTYKGFDLNVFFQWSYGNQVLNANKIYMEGAGLAGLWNINQFASYANRWTPTNPSNTIPRLFAQGNLGVWSSRYIEDASFLRLKTVSLGYNLPMKYLNKIKIKSARFYCSAQNIFTWTKYSGPDPEVSVKGFGLTPNFDFSAYPMSRALVFGAEISF